MSLSSDHVLIEAPSKMEGAANVRVPPTNHYALPSHPVVLGLLAAELDALAAVATPPSAP